MKKSLKICVIVISILALTVFLVNIESISDLLEKEIEKSPAPPNSNDQVITLNDIKGFPKPVRQFLLQAKIIGKKRINNVRIELEGHFKLDKTKPFMKIRTVQYTDINNISRTFFIKARMMGFIVMIGKDSYVNGKGNMSGKLMHFFRLFNENGFAFDVGELTIFLNDLFAFYPSGLITLKDHFKWIVINKKLVEIIFTHKNNSVKARVEFDEKYRLINFYTTDRFYKDAEMKNYDRRKWSTPLGDHREVKGRIIPHYGKAVWHLKSGDFCYVKIRLKKIEYNVK